MPTVSPSKEPTEEPAKKRLRPNSGNLVIADQDPQLQKSGDSQNEVSDTTDCWLERPAPMSCELFPEHTRTSQDVTDSTTCPTPPSKMIHSDKLVFQNQPLPISAFKSSLHIKDSDKKLLPWLGVLRLDYDYEPALGDIDHPASFPYPVFYIPIKGLTFKKCQIGEFDEEIEKRVVRAVKTFDADPRVRGITGDCGFMLRLQQLVRDHTRKPVFMSSLIYLPTLVSLVSPLGQVLILTANKKNLETMSEEIERYCGADVGKENISMDIANKGKDGTFLTKVAFHKYEIVDCSGNYTSGPKEGLPKVDGFEAVENCTTVDTVKVEKNLMEYCKTLVGEKGEYPNAECILMECTELPAYADAVRFALYDLGMPVYSAVTVCNAFISGVTDNMAIGADWMKK